MLPTRPIDHLVYTVPNLEAAIDDLEAKLGIRPVFGGYHDTQGTKNALVNLDNGAYLEILAADDNNTAISPPRWMGVDCLTRARMTRWAIKSEALPADSNTLRAYDEAMGTIFGGSRQTASGGWLRWEMILPTAEPEVDILPFMVDWRKSDVHPHEVLPNMGCSLVEVYATHPEPEMVLSVLEQLGVGLRVEKGPQIDLRMKLECPKGIIEL
ncbi:VOC family protein [Neolewinella persica]|uniref:VOC family protein n=1 Tax=Neolewinella persica TaxID=70998 RepID=UPI000363BC08|nr:VOC family protein [Neolewinella persica]